MNDEEFLTFLRYLMTMNEDDVAWVLTAATGTVLADAQITLQKTADRVNREIMRRGWENLTEVPS